MSSSNVHIPTRSSSTQRYPYDPTLLGPQVRKTKNTRTTKKTTSLCPVTSSHTKVVEETTEIKSMYYYKSKPAKYDPYYGQGYDEDEGYNENESYDRKYAENEGDEREHVDKCYDREHDGNSYRQRNYHHHGATSDYQNDEDHNATYADSATIDPTTTHKSLRPSSSPIVSDFIDLCTVKPQSEQQAKTSPSYNVDAEDVGTQIPVENESMLVNVDEDSNGQRIARHPRPRKYIPPPKEIPQGKDYKVLISVSETGIESS